MFASNESTLGKNLPVLCAKYQLTRKQHMEYYKISLNLKG